jgi:hypothetical protein
MTNVLLYKPISIKMESQGIDFSNVVGKIVKYPSDLIIMGEDGMLAYPSISAAADAMPSFHKILEIETNSNNYYQIANLYYIKKGYARAEYNQLEVFDKLLPKFISSFCNNYPLLLIAISNRELLPILSNNLPKCYATCVWFLTTLYKEYPDSKDNIIEHLKTKEVGIKAEFCKYTGNYDIKEFVNSSCVIRWNTLVDPQHKIELPYKILYSNSETSGYFEKSILDIFQTSSRGLISKNIFKFKWFDSKNFELLEKIDWRRYIIDNQLYDFYALLANQKDVLDEALLTVNSFKTLQKIFNHNKSIEVVDYIIHNSTFLEKIDFLCSLYDCLQLAQDNYEENDWTDNDQFYLDNKSYILSKIEESKSNIKSSEAALYWFSKFEGDYTVLQFISNEIDALAALFVDRKAINYIDKKYISDIIYTSLERLK